MDVERRAEEVTVTLAAFGLPMVFVGCLLMILVAIWAVHGSNRESEPWPYQPKLYWAAVAAIWFTGLTFVLSGSSILYISFQSALR